MAFHLPIANKQHQYVGMFWGSACMLFGKIQRFVLTYRDLETLMERLETAPAGSHPRDFDCSMAQSQWVQYRLLLQRNFVSYWRNPSYNCTRYEFVSSVPHSLPDDGVTKPEMALHYFNKECRKLEMRALPFPSPRLWTLKVFFNSIDETDERHMFMCSCMF